MAFPNVITELGLSDETQKSLSEALEFSRKLCRKYGIPCSNRIIREEKSEKEKSENSLSNDLLSFRNQISESTASSSSSSTRSLTTKFPHRVSPEVRQKARDLLKELSKQRAEKQEEIEKDVCVVDYDTSLLSFNGSTSCSMSIPPSTRESNENKTFTIEKIRADSTDDEDNDWTPDSSPGEKTENLNDNSKPPSVYDAYFCTTQSYTTPSEPTFSS
ncbi:unnamed protein product [Caenorhabditis auriculariae]|uniref:Uncharacterized protein n=1 Tax=Caenorhabditis auriculariae TaxID=2777116 RepID=A0A8S1GQ78_9PELO|nr:unnamed protein product [Caenorhabditis auriculariae]